MRDGAGRAHAVRRKRTAVDLVTEYDRRSEAHVVAALARRLSRRRRGRRGGRRRSGSSGRRWLVDPLDGTTNFAHGLPFFCVSIGLEDAAGALVGVVEAPALGWTFFAARGAGACRRAGARRRQRRLAVSDTDALAASLLATGFPYDNGTEPRNNFAAVVAHLSATQGCVASAPPRSTCACSPPAGSTATGS